MAYDNFAAQLEALRNGVPSSEVFAGGVGGTAGMPNASTLGSGPLGTAGLGSIYNQWGIDPNANPFQGQLAKAFPNGGYPSAAPATAPAVGGGGPRFGRTGGYGLSSNPYEGDQADALRAQQQQFLDQNFNQVRSSAVGVGGLGGSRQGVMEGTALGQAATGLSGALANLYGSNWNADQNRALSQYGMDQGFYSAQRGLDQSGAALGASLYNQGTAGQWNPLNQANGIYGNYTGFGNTTNSSNSGGGALGGVGGLLGGATYAANRGWWG